METIKLGDYVSIRTGKLDANANDKNGKYPFFTCSIKTLRINSFSYDCECVLVAGNGDLNVKYYNGKFDAYQRTYIIQTKNKNILDTKFLYYCLSKYIDTLRNQSIGGIIKYIKLSNLTEAKIILPNIDLQKRYVEILNLAQTTINKKQQQYKLLVELEESLFIDMFGDILISDNNLVLFNEIIMIDTISTKNFEFYSEYPHIGIENIEKQTGKLKNLKKVKDSNLKSIKYIFSENHIIYSKIRPYLNKVAMPDFSGLCSSDAYPLLVNEDVANKVFIGHLLRQDIFLNYIEKNSTRTNIPKVNKTQLKNFSFNLPPLSLQNDFAQKIEKIEELKKQCQKSLEYYEELYETLLHKAFNGELFNE
ncbi:restriction endonuclease subunit S [Staphylococcus hominis]|uniref:restriction endonuclease subunit S n=1 Tax=Staphylococcus hominis TaxID=1290 RepID=UPI00098B8F04|nr:restriction endonuclease subunit S [Staphylococcus hominis]TBW90977.1 restriction endonuclease subunit S [Staphylococcus hominis]UNQ68023.1 restriction endonuclease subunit S [Staphylococcus hominis]